MPQVKRTNKLVRNHLWASILLGSPVLACFAYLYLMEEIPANIHPVYVILAVLPVLMIGLWLQNRRWTHFTCPDCGQSLEREMQLDGKPLTFHCERCNIIWDTGFTDQMDS